MYTILQITDTAVGAASIAAAVLLTVLTVVMALVALGPYLPWSLGKELDAEAAGGVDDSDAADEA